MNENNPTSSPAAVKTGLFRTADGNNYFVPFVLLTSLFVLWGFCNGTIDILNKHFQDALQLTKEQSGLVQSANYLAYFLMAIPAGLIARQFGYKGGILLGLALIGAGAFWVVHAVDIGTYLAFLMGLFIIALGMTCLETIANPYTTVLGPPESGATRINIAQTFNGAGWILGPTIGGLFVFAGDKTGATNADAAAAAAAAAAGNAGLQHLYLGIAAVVSILLVIFIFSKIPDLRTQDEGHQSAGQIVRIKPSGGQAGIIGLVLLVVCGLLYFFISRILELVWDLLRWDKSLFLPTTMVLLVVAYIAAFLMVHKNWDMFRRRHFTLGIAAQFLYVAAQTGVFSFFVNYVLENDIGVTKLEASKMLGTIGFGLFAAGRLCGSAVISQAKPHLVLAAYAAINVALTAIAMTGGTPGLYAV